MLYHDWKTSRCCNRCIFSLTTCEALRHTAPFLLHLSGISPEKCQVELCSKYVRENIILMSYLDKSYFVQAEVVYVASIQRMSGDKLKR